MKSNYKEHTLEQMRSIFVTPDLVPQERINNWYQFCLYIFGPDISSDSINFDYLLLAMSEHSSTRDIEILEMRYGLNDGIYKERRECAEKLGVSRQLIHQIIQKTSAPIMESYTSISKTGIYDRMLRIFADSDHVPSERISNWYKLAQDIFGKHISPGSINFEKLQSVIRKYRNRRNIEILETKYGLNDGIYKERREYAQIWNLKNTNVDYILSLTRKNVKRWYDGYDEVLRIFVDSDHVPSERIGNWYKLAQDIFGKNIFQCSIYLEKLQRVMLKYRNRRNIEILEMRYGLNDGVYKEQRECAQIWNLSVPSISYILKITCASLCNEYKSLQK